MMSRIGQAAATIPVMNRGDCHAHGLPSPDNFGVTPGPCAMAGERLAEGWSPDQTPGRRRWRDARWRVGSRSICTSGPTGRPVAGSGSISGAAAGCSASSADVDSGDYDGHVFPVSRSCLAMMRFMNPGILPGPGRLKGGRADHA